MILLFLLHIRSSLIVASTLPVAVLLAFVAMKTFGVDANIMSLAGIAIAIGTMVDMGIIVSENIYQHLADWEKEGSSGGAKQRSTVIANAATEVAPAVVTAVTTTTFSSGPVVEARTYPCPPKCHPCHSSPDCEAVSTQKEGLTERT